jgi:hypothetical protein
MPSANNLKNKAQGVHSHGGISRGRTKARKKRPEKAKEQHAGPHTSGAAQGPQGGTLDSSLRTLLLGEGNFAFASALALQWGECGKLTATTEASESSTLELDDAEDNVELVKAFGGAVAFKVDATNCAASERVSKRGAKGFERIVFNFPSAAAAAGAPHQLVEASQALLRGLFKSVLSGRLLARAGEMHVTLRPSEALKWRLVDLAKLAGMRVKACGPFDAAACEGYVPPPGEAVTYVFTELPPKVDKESEKALAIAKLAKAHPELRIGPTGQTYKEAWKQRHSKAGRTRRGS